MGIAFGWAIFMVRSCSRSSSMLKYSKEAIPVHGHVLQSKVDLHEGGIPSYRALIDYVYEYKGSTFQVRKAFDTEQLLELGFSNVELLVLPAEPTSGILVKRWETEYELEQKEEVSRRRWLYITLALGGIFVLLSSAGATLAVLQLPQENQIMGWICLASAIVLLGPLSFFFYRYTTRCYNATKQSVEDGMIIRGNAASVAQLQLPLDPCDALGGCGALDAPTPSAAPWQANRASRKQWVEQATAASRYYFVCMPQRVDSMMSDISAVSSLSMKSIKEDDIKTVGMLL
jgi:hypothetical protein